MVLNGREGEEDRDADYWLRLIESFGGNSPVIVVLNKFREHPFDVNRRALQQKYVGIREFIGTDCKDGKGIKELHRAVERETDRLDDLRVKFPASWVAIKDRLAGMKENFLDFDTYREECTKLGEIETGAQEKLAGYLHSLGIALNFKDDPRLQETHVLNPHWVTNGIYKILNARQLAEGKGRSLLTTLRGFSTRTRTRTACMPSCWISCGSSNFVFPSARTHQVASSFPSFLTNRSPPRLVNSSLKHA